MNDRQINRLAVSLASAMGVALLTASVLDASPAQAAEQTRPLVSLEATFRSTTAVTRPLLMARSVQSPCEATTARYKAAQVALAGGDIDAADDIAVIAQALIEQCGWTRTDAALGGQ